MSASRAVEATAAEPESVRGVDWAVLALLAGVALLSGFLEVLLVPLEVGTVYLPVSVVLALGGNLLLPRLGFALVRATAGALIPVVAWIIPVIGLVLVTPPGGDVLVTGGGGQQWIYYLTVLIGCGAGLWTFVSSSAAVARANQSGAVRVR